MKKNNGFTLAELMAVLAVLAVVALIVFPSISKTIKNSKKKAYDQQVQNILRSAESWGLENMSKFESGYTYISPSQLKSDGYLESKQIMDPTKKNKEMNGCVIGKYNSDYGQYTYDYYDFECSELQEQFNSCFVFDESTGTITDYYQYINNDSSQGRCYSDVIIPEYINNIPVVEIKRFSFDDKGLTSVVIPDSVVSIGDYAFYDNSLTSVIIGSNVQDIGYNAFRYNKLTSVVIPDSVISIGYDAFSENQLTKLSLGNNLQSISARTFEDNKLTSVIIPSSVTTIGEDAFAGNRLTSITIPSSVITIGSAAFNDNQLPDDQAFIYARNSDGSEDKTTVISYGGAKRDGVVIPNSVTYVGEKAFEFNNLTSVNIPSSVTIIGEYAFWANSLTDLTLSYGVTDIQDHAFYSNELESIILSDSVVNIGESAFAANQLTTVTIPVNVKTIGYDAFSKAMDSNPKLTKIINKTGRSFNWRSITWGSSNATFVTGTVPHNRGNITVTSS